MQRKRLVYEEKQFKEKERKNVNKEIGLRIGNIIGADVLSRKNVTTTLLKFKGRSIKIITV